VEKLNMKATIGFLFFLLFLAGIALVTLKGRQMAEQGLSSGGAGITGVEWRPAVIGSSVIPVDSGISISFDVDGSIKGNGGCNGFFGSLVQSDSGIEVSPLGATSMACQQRVMDRETSFLEAVQKTTGFGEVRGGVNLLDDEGNVLVELVGSAGE
jgi:heat shock protein HslJ